MRHLPGMLALALVALPVLAQEPAKQTQPVVVLQSPNLAGCPVGFTARHTGNGGLEKVSPAGRHPGQVYRLAFLPRVGHDIAQARVTLHGLAGATVIPAGQSGRADSAESFNVSPSVGENHGFHSTIYTERLTGVQWVELNELTYADGTTWHESTTAVCRIVPNGYMLVAAGK